MLPLYDVALSCGLLALRRVPALLVLHGAEVTQRGMQPPVIIEGYPVEHRVHGLPPGGELSPVQTGSLKPSPEALGRCVVPAIPLSAHGRAHAPVAHGALERGCNTGLPRSLWKIIS